MLSAYKMSKGRGKTITNLSGFFGGFPKVMLATLGLGVYTASPCPPHSLTAAWRGIQRSDTRPEDCANYRPK